jgi:hypothetical protein
MLYAAGAVEVRYKKLGWRMENGRKKIFGVTAKEQQRMSSP